MPLALVGMLALYGVWQLTPLGRAAGQEFVSDVFFWPVDMVAVGACWLAARRCAVLPRLARAWKFFALAVLAQLLGDVSYTLIELVGQAPYPSLADASYLAFYPLALFGLLSLPKAAFGDHPLLLLDLAIVSLGGSALLVYLVLGPTALAENGGFLATAVTVAYPVGDIVAITGLALVLLRGALPSVRLPLYLVSSALALFVVADVGYSYQTLHDSYSNGSWEDALWLVALALFAVAASLQQRPQPQQSAAIRVVPPRINVLPFAAVTTGFALLLYTDINDTLFPDLTITLIALTLAALLSLRQYRSQRALLRVTARLDFQALHDGLTGLPNRMLFADRLEHALARRRRREDSRVAVLMMDVNEFKAVNDTLGHAAGDQLLVELAERLRAACRADETVARLGGDEFCVVSEGRLDSVELTALAGRVLGVFADPFLVAGQPRLVSGSLGIALAEPGLELTEELLGNADLAMYRAKTSGNGGYEFFDDVLRTEVQRRIEIVAALEAALLAGIAPQLHYQPIVRVADGSVIAVEALARWNTPRFGQVPPAEFIPLAAAHDLIVPLGRRVQTNALTQLARWRAEDPQALPGGVYVNVSAIELRQPDLADFIIAALSERGLPPGDLTLELSESAYIDVDDEATDATLTRLLEAGVHFAVDDAGTGYSSLTTLKRIPLTALKIDRSFLDEIKTPTDDAPITRAIVALCHELDVLVVSEGVETNVQYEYLRRIGCDAAQGYFLARPADAQTLQLAISNKTISI